MLYKKIKYYLGLRPERESGLLRPKPGFYIKLMLITKRQIHKPVNPNLVI